MTAATTTRAKRKQDRESRMMCVQRKIGASEKRGREKHQPALLIFLLLLFSSLLLHPDRPSLDTNTAESGARHKFYGPKTEGHLHKR
jgi:hypothetical protein